MTRRRPLVSRIYIKVDDNEVQRPVMQKLLELEVDQHTHLPDMFTIRFHDPGLALLDQGPFDLTKTVEIAAAGEDGEQVTLMCGEITALEPEFQEGMIAELVVRGYDRSHRLYRETRSRAFLNKKDSDLAEEFAQAADLQTDISPTSTVYDHIFQHNQSDLAFLMQRAWRIGYECFVADGKLTFRPPADAGDASVTLTWGQDLQEFRPRMTLAEQVDEVHVRGWNVEQQEAIVGRAENGNLYPQLSESQDGAQWASAFGTGKRVIVDQPVVSQAEADALATARLDEISGAFVEAEGIAFRRPDIRAGQAVTLEALGARLSGTYLVTAAMHRYTADGLETSFAVRGTRTGLLAEQIVQQTPLDRWPGVVTGVVTNVDDPLNWGRVKLCFPWMADDAESDWARVMGPGAGPDCGLYAIPEVDDEVLVAFAQGEFSRPYVIGSLWNGQLDRPPEAANGGEQPLVRIWRSRTGHALIFYDDAENKVEVKTAGGHTIVLDDANSKIELVSSGGLSLTLDDNGRKVTVSSSGDIELTAGGNLKLDASGNMDLRATGQVTVQGSTINLN